MKHSEPMTAVCHFKQWVEGWNNRIENFSHRETYQKRIDATRHASDNIAIILGKMEESKTKGKEPKEAVDALMQLQSSNNYIQLDNVRRLLLSLSFEFEDMKEIINRCNDRVFQLEVELSKVINR